MAFSRCRFTLKFWLLFGCMAPTCYAVASPQQGKPDWAGAVNDGMRLRLSQELAIPSTRPAPVQNLGLVEEGHSVKQPLALRLSGSMSNDQPMATGGDSQPEASEAPPNEALFNAYYEGAYREVGARGLAALEENPDNHALRYAVANSLAWSGQEREALDQYGRLLGTEFHDRALLGQAHVNRWSGRPHLSAPAYREVLSRDPENQEAGFGLELAVRALRPRSGVQAGRAANSSGSARSWVTASQSWRDQSGARIFRLSADRLDEEKNGMRLRQRDLAFRFEDLDVRLQPELELSVQQAPRNALFGSVSVLVPDTSLRLAAGKINWGKHAFDPLALRDGLTARQLGGSAALHPALGAVRVSYDNYRVSDGNLVQSGQVRFTPALQPLAAAHLRGFVGAEARKARFEDTRYWSPSEGHYSVFVGLGADWSDARWQLYGSIQYGVAVAGESGRSWSTGFGARRWLGNDWALSLNFWAIHTPRDGGYRAHSGTVLLEYLW